MSDEGTIRLSIESIRSGASRVVLGSASLELLSRAVRTLLAGRMGEGALENSLRRDGLLGSGERVVTRRFGVSEQEVLLISLEAMSTGPGRPALTVSQVVKKLGTMERRVALLAAEGYAVLNIAANLSISEATVRTHLRRAYFKLGVHNRAELACAILEMRAPRAH